MKLDRASHDPGQLLEFYEEGMAALGALCERTWHDRLEVVAEGRAATLWNPQGTLHEVELHFMPSDTTSARDAAREVFPGCPLTFQLAEALRPMPLALERFVLADDAASRPPDSAVAEKLWRSQFANTSRWQLAAPFKADFHFSLIAVARCEIQAMDQHWSLHRLAISLPGGESDEALARDIGFHQETAESTAEIIIGRHSIRRDGANCFNWHLKTKWPANWTGCVPGRKTACAVNWNVLMTISRKL